MNKYDWKNKEKFLKDWSESKNICNFLIRNKLTATSGNYITFKKWLDIHLNKNVISIVDKNNLSTVFTENSSLARHYIKKLLKQHNLIPYKCKCGNDGIWNGAPITLQLEHKNGINNDNRLENLEYLCPNCHSQTNSYMSQNYHLKIFEKRLIDIKQYNCINRTIVIELSKKWKLSYANTRYWIKTYSHKIESCNIKVDLFNKEQIKINNLNISIRFSDVNLITNKKEVPKLAAQWNVSVNGAKKWIRNNIPESFDEIYDNRHLIKHKESLEKQAIIDYIQSLTIESNMEDIMEKTNIQSKSGLYAMIKLYNPSYYNKISSPILCKYCEGKTRTSGKMIVNKIEVPRYKCKNCQKSFTLFI